MGIFILAVGVMRMASGTLTGTEHVGKVSPTPVKGENSNVTLRFQLLGGESFDPDEQIVITLPLAYDLSSYTPFAVATFASSLKPPSDPSYIWEPTVLKDFESLQYKNITVVKITESKPHKVVLTNIGSPDGDGYFGCRTDAKVVLDIGSPRTAGAQRFTIFTQFKTFIQVDIADAPEAPAVPAAAPEAPAAPAAPAAGSVKWVLWGLAGATGVVAVGGIVAFFWRVKATRGRKFFTNRLRLNKEKS